MLNICVAQKYMQTYDDSVLKLSIKQGEEHDRFPSKTVGIDSIDYNVTSTLPGSFTSGELAYTRDTNRVFVGNFTTEPEFLYENPTADIKNLKVQQTVGGTLVGNKYLGYIDSKPPYNNDLKDSKPLLLSNDTTLVIDNTTITEPALLKKDSAFRSYEFTSGSQTCKLTEDGNWSRQSYYNSEYDAYDGDYMYDIYRNALIIFDHNIKPTAENELPKDNEIKNSRRRSIITPLDTDRKDDSPQTVYDHTIDMYGDGYVCIYNVIPDGDTLTFKKREFSNTTGKPEGGNYTQNIIKVQKVYPNAMIGALDSSAFTLSNNKNSITLAATQRFSEIKLPENNDDATHLILPSTIGLYNNVLIDFAQLPSGTSINNTYELQFQRNGERSGYDMLSASFVPRRSMPSYTLQLGHGLIAADGSNKIEFNENNTIGKISITSSTSSDASALTGNPFSLSDTDSASLFTSNLILGIDGGIRGENVYPDVYSKAVKNITKQYDNENTKLNYLVESTPILSNTSGSAAGTFKFKVSPVVYCAKRNSNSIKAVGIFNDVVLSTPPFVYTDSDNTVTNVQASTQTIKVDSLKDIWIYTQNGVTDIPSEYSKYNDNDNYVYIMHPINAIHTRYIGDDDSSVSVKNIEAGQKIVICKNENNFTILVKDIDETIVETYENVSKLYNALRGVFYNDLSEIYQDFIEAEPPAVITEVIINEFNTNNLDITEDLRLELENSDGVSILSIPTKKYVTKITHTIEKELLDGEEVDTYIFADNNSKLDNISKLEFFGRIISVSDEDTEPITNFDDYHKVYEGNELKEYLLSKGNEFIIDENVLIQKSNGLHIYMIKITNIDGETHNYEFITNNISLDEKVSADNYIVKTVDSQVVEYALFGDNNNKVLLVEETTSTSLEEHNFYLSDEFYIDSYLNARAFYYGDDEERYCLGGYMSADELEKWKEQRRIDIMRQFPLIPTHATSIILECTTEAGSSLKLKQIGNNKDRGYEKETLKDIKTSINGVILPTELKASDWVKEKTLVDMAENSTQYIEVPVSIDANNNKHFTFDVYINGSAIISIAAYRV